MNAHRVLAMVFVGSCLAIGAPCHAATGETRLVPSAQLRDVVDVRDVRLSDDGTVTGVVLNRSSHPIRDVELVVKYVWLWNHEMRPGNDGPGRAVFVTVPQEIPPGGQVPFTYRGEGPLPDRADGRFVPRVDVSSITEITNTTADAGQPVPGTTRALRSDDAAGDAPPMR